MDPADTKGEWSMDPTMWRWDTAFAKVIVSQG